MTKSLIIGANGQDGWFLGQHLRACDHEIWGISRTKTIDPKGSPLPAIDITDPDAVASLISDTHPDHIYFLAAVHHSSDDPGQTSQRIKELSHKVHVVSLQNFLTAMEKHAPSARMFYAASSHLFAAKSTDAPISETSPFAPQGIYGHTKLQGVRLCQNARKNQNLFAVSGYLFNHESWRRKPDFLSRKIVQSVVRILRGQQSELILHNLSAQVDWSFAADVVRAMHLMLQMDEPDDLVIASGKLHSVQDFAQQAFETVGLEWRDYVTEEPDQQQKPTLVQPLVGDASRLRRLTGWSPKVDFRQMIELMIEMELEYLRPEPAN